MRADDLGGILAHLDCKQLVVTEGGRRKRMGSLEAHYCRLFSEAIQGDLESARMIIKLIKDYKRDEPEPPRDTKVIVVNDSEERDE